MADETGTTAAVQGTQQGEAQSAAAAPAQGAGAKPQATNSQGEGQPQSTDGDDNPTALRERIAKLEGEAYQYRERERQRQAAQPADGDSTEQLQTLQRQVTEMKAQGQEQSLHLAVVTAAQRLGFRNTELAYRALDKSQVEYAPDGAAGNVDKLLTELAKEEPALLVGTDFGGGPRGSSAQGAQGGDSTMNDLIRGSAGR